MDELPAITTVRVRAEVRDDLEQYRRALALQRLAAGEAEPSLGEAFADALATAKKCRHLYGDDLRGAKAGA